MLRVDFLPSPQGKVPPEAADEEQVLPPGGGSQEGYVSMTDKLDR